jgi:hypothetical protein
MIRTILPLIIALFVVPSIAAQGRSFDEIKRQIRGIGSEKIFTLTYDQQTDTTKLMAVAANFDQKEAAKAGTQAINFAAAFTFAGKKLTASPETIPLTFWVLTKKPQFAASNRWIVTAGTETIDLGDARYAAKSSENMEYLNFVVPFDDLKKIAVKGAKFKLGSADFTFTAEQTKLLSDLIKLSTP